FLLGDLCFAFLGHSILAFPSGRVRGHWPRLLVVAGYATVVVFPLAVLLLHGEEGPLIAMGSPLVLHRSLLLVADHPHAVRLLQQTEVVVFYGVLAALFIAVIGRRLVQATPRARKLFAPLLFAAVALAIRAVWENVHTFAGGGPLGYSYLFWWQIAAV